ncbi:hypothetical protein Adt_16030 [Abeliophyllum distichum]|uniref:Uncharacterized protein n=1 Tax=Abeliophyllum distichum TaxID=126358 RepID=A0ABD1TCJ3_9LAMI
MEIRSEAIHIDAALSLREADDPFRANVVRWTALDVPSIMVEEYLTKLREAYRIPADIELILLGPNERACFLKRGCTTLHLNAFVSGMRLPLHPMLRRILRAYDLAPTQPRKLPNKKGREEEAECGKSHSFRVSGNWQRVFDDPEPDLDVSSVYGLVNSIPCCELLRDIIDIVRSIYQADSKTRSYGLILNRHRCLVELGLMASKGENREVVEASKVIEVDDAPKEKVPLSRKRKARASGTETSQARRNAVEVVDNYVVCSAPSLQRTLAVNKSGEVVLEGPSKSTQAPGDGDGGPYDSKRRFKELIGAPGVRIPDDALRNLPFYPTMGAQAVKKYFTPKWEEFSSHGELEDVLEASLADEALEAANKEKRPLLEEAKSRDEEIQSLRKALESSENGRKEVEVGRNEVEAKLANAEAEFVANFHNTEAYTNFSDYFARIGQQEVLTALKNDHLNFNLGPLEARFPPPDVEGEEENYILVLALYFLASVPCNFCFLYNEYYFQV